MEGTPLDEKEINRTWENFLLWICGIKELLYLLLGWVSVLLTAGIAGLLLIEWSLESGSFVVLLSTLALLVPTFLLVSFLIWQCNRHRL